MIRASNIIILAIVVLGHYGLIYTVLASPPMKQYEQNLEIAGTILEATLIELSPQAPPIPIVEQASDLVELIAVKSKEGMEIPVTEQRYQQIPVKEIPIEPPVIAPLEKSNIVPPKEPVRRAQASNTVSRMPANGGSGMSSQNFVPPSHKGTDLGNKKPRYPELSIKRKEEGQVTLLAKVLPSGRAKSVRVHKSSGYPRLDQSAVKSAEGYRYKPAEQAGERIPYDYYFTVTFTLQK